MTEVINTTRMNPSFSESTDGSVLLRPEQLADWLNLSRGTVYELIGEGTIRSVKVGRSRRITVSAVRDFVADLDGCLGWGR